MYVYSSAALHSFRKHSFHVSDVKAKLPEPHFSVCSIGLKRGNIRIFCSIVLFFFFFLVTHEMKMKHYFSCRLETSGLPGRQ